MLSGETAEYHIQRSNSRPFGNAAAEPRKDWHDDCSEWSDIIPFVERARTSYYTSFLASLLRRKSLK
eukprot:scaffold327862_cov33-Prasinocladus_malaysianus.AAC.1